MCGMTVMAVRLYLRETSTPSIGTRSVQTVVLNLLARSRLCVTYSLDCFVEWQQRTNIFPSRTSTDYDLVKRNWAAPRPRLGGISMYKVSRDSSLTPSGRN